MPPLLAAVLRCNTYDPDEYVPVVVAAGGDGAAMEQVGSGWGLGGAREQLTPPLILTSPNLTLTLSRSMEQVGWANPEVLEALAPQLAAGKTCA